uniref:Uncharacterized protein n=1 Tax=Amorphochlora amoebiformis TaxID=1561963 RepID=A0A7S0DI21_9EUKA|mmetsp:Transcript_2914/g.4442  ORF Transcript_2914/g.4442 Transcript_2914/m.4442 type:complete len:440 (+) Transcript_2914:51-1370(+)
MQLAASCLFLVLIGLADSYGIAGIRRVPNFMAPWKVRGRVVARREAWCGQAKRKKPNPNVERGRREKLEIINLEAVEEYSKKANAVGRGVLKPDPDRKLSLHTGEHKELYDTFKSVLNPPKQQYEGPGSKMRPMSWTMRNVGRPTLFQHYVDEPDEDESEEEREVRLQEQEKRKSEIAEALSILENEGEGAFLDRLEQLYGNHAEAVLRDLQAFARRQAEGFPEIEPVDPFVDVYQFRLDHDSGAMPTTLDKPQRPGYSSIPRSVRPDTSHLKKQVEKVELKAKPETKDMKNLKRAIEMKKENGNMGQLLQSIPVRPQTPPFPRRALVAKPAKPAPMSAAADFLPLSAAGPTPPEVISSSTDSLPAPAPPSKAAVSLPGATADGSETVKNLTRRKKKKKQPPKLVEVDFPPKNKGNNGEGDGELLSRPPSRPDPRDTKH